MHDLLPGPDWDVPFRDSPFRLRFELGGEVFGNADAPVPRFAQAFDRARAIANDVLAASACAFAVVEWFVPPRNMRGRARTDGFEALRRMGFTPPALAAWQGPRWPETDVSEGGLFEWRVFDVSDAGAARDVLLWNSIAQEMAIEPKAWVHGYLVDLVRGIVLRAYDDRGMDVTALAPDPLLPIYCSRDAWLLDYDRPRMTEAFGTLQRAPLPARDATGSLPA